MNAQPHGLFGVVSGIVTKKGGEFSASVDVVARKAGTYWTEGREAGYNVYIGVNGLPDFTAGPDMFSTTLPIVIPTTPPGMGSKTYNVVVRKVNATGLESQNQKAWTFSINSLSQPLLPPIDPPINVAAYLERDGAIRVVGIYPSAGAENHADEWRMWYDTTPPDVSDPYDMNTVVAGKSMRPIVTGGNAAGTYHIALALYRTADDYLSPETRVQITVPVALDSPLPY